jgi:hypothetical protein
MLVNVHQKDFSIMKQPSSICPNRALLQVARVLMGPLARGTVVAAALAMQLPTATAQTACVIPTAPAVAWGGTCFAPQAAASLNPGQMVTVQNAAAGYVGSLTRICALNGILATIAAPCAARAAILPKLLQGQSGGDWTLSHAGQTKPVTLTVNSTGGCTSTHNFVGSALVNRDGSITLTVPPYSGFASCTAPRPYLQNPTSCTLTSPSDGQSVFTFAPGFEVTSVPAENGKGGGCR